MNPVPAIEQALRSQQPEEAARALVPWLQVSPPDDPHFALLAEAIANVYRDLHVHAIHRFHELLSAQAPEHPVTIAFAQVRPDMEATREWNQRLEYISSERLANEVVERVKANEMAQAENSAVSLITGLHDNEQRARRAKQIGYSLGGLVHEKDRAQALIRGIARNPAKYGLDPIAATEVEEEFARASIAAARREQSITGVSRAQLTEAVVELGRSMPARNALHQPTDEDLLPFDRAMRSIFRCCLVSAGYDKYHEATMLMVEFSAKEVSAAGALAGVEQRLYATLGRTGRAVAAQVLNGIGKNRIALETYTQFSREHLHEKIGRLTIETLGLLGSPQSVAYLSDVLNERRANARTEAIFALGSIGTPQAQAALLQVLAHDLRGKPEGEARRDAFSVISALGRAVRSMPEMNSRAHTIAQVLKLLPKDDLEFPVRAVLNFFTGKQDGMNPTLLSWAAQTGVAALWSIDRPELARAGRAQPLGFRQPLIDLLGRLAPHTMPVINQAVLQHAKVYNGAYLAVGELYLQHPDPSQVPVIRQLLLNAALHDDAPRSEYVKDTVLDTATDQRHDLRKDQVIASLVYALDKIGTPEAQDLMTEIFDQIQSGRLPSPGTETADILMRAHMKGQKDSGRATMAPGVASSQDGNEVTPTTVTEQDLAHMADLEATYLLAGKRRTKKVAAMASLANRKITAAAKLIISHLADSDPIIASAAFTALQDMGSGPIAKSSLDQLHRELVSSLENGDNVVRVKTGEVLAKLGPARSPLKERLEKLAAKADLPAPARAVLTNLLGGRAAGAPREPARALSAENLDPEKLGAAAQFMPKAGLASKGGAGIVTDLDKKRAYLQARQEWIRGGKRGPEPQPPQ